MENTIHIINLERNIERRNHMINELQATPFKFIFFKAIEHKDGWRGCLKSHLELIFMAKEKNMDYIIVCEDDLVIKERELFNTRMPIILNWLKNNLDQWQIYHDGPTIFKASDISKDYRINSDISLYSMKHVASATFIIYNKNIFDFFLKYKNIDINSLKNKHKIDCITHTYYELLKPYPIMVSQKNGMYSDINSKVRNDIERLYLSSIKYFNIHIKKYSEKANNNINKQLLAFCQTYLLVYFLNNNFI
jgi:GR25 family glycosyltransferase involved in LPS biosynthesis